MSFRFLASLPIRFVLVTWLCASCGNEPALEELALPWWNASLEMQILDTDISGDGINDVVSVSNTELERFLQCINPVDGSVLGEFSIAKPSTEYHRLKVLACSNPIANEVRLVVSTGDTEDARAQVKLVDLATGEIVWSLDGSNVNRVALCTLGDLNGDGWSDLAIVEGGSTDEDAEPKPDFVVVRSGESGEKISEMKLPTDEVSWRRGICRVLGTKGTVAVGSPQEYGGGPVAILDLVEQEVVSEFSVPDRLRFGSTVVSQDRVGAQIWSLGGADEHFLVECRTSLLLFAADGTLVDSLRCYLFGTEVVGDVDGDGYRDFITSKSEIDRSIFAEISGKGSEPNTVFSGRDFTRLWETSRDTPSTIWLKAGVLGDVDGRGRDDWMFIDANGGWIVLGESWK